MALMTILQAGDHVVAAGALLGLAGALAQGLFRNPLADPYLLGSSAGAALGVAVLLALIGVSPAATARGSAAQFAPEMPASASATEGVGMAMVSLRAALAPAVTSRLPLSKKARLLILAG